MRWAAFLVVAIAACPSIGFAQTDADGPADTSPDARAAGLYDRGVEAHERGFFADAAKFFADADALAPNDVTLETALRECIRADAAVLAMVLHERASRVSSPSAGLREVLSEVATAFGERVGYVRLACEDCRATIDGAALDDAIELPVEPGSRSILFEGSDAAFVIQLGPGEHLTVSPRVVAQPIVEPSGIHPAWLTIGVVATAGFGAASIGSYVQADALANELGTLRAAHVIEGAADVSAAGQNAETRMYAFIALTGVSALVTTALAIWAVDWTGPRPTTISLGPGAVHASVHF